MNPGKKERKEIVCCQILLLTIGLLHFMILVFIIIIIIIKLITKKKSAIISSVVEPFTQFAFCFFVELIPRGKILLLFCIFARFGSSSCFLFLLSEELSLHNIIFKYWKKEVPTKMAAVCSRKRHPTKQIDMKKWHNKGRKFDLFCLSEPQSL